MKDEDIMEIRKYVYSKSKEFFQSGIKLFLISKRHILKADQGRIESITTADNFFSIRNLSQERGPVLDIFSKMEYIINQLLTVQILGFFSNKADDLEKVLTYVNLSTKIKILYSWDIVGKKRLFERLTSLRNRFAHSWSIVGIIYKGAPLIDVFMDFLEDMVLAWTELFNAYERLEDKFGLTKEMVLEKLQ